MRNTCVPRIYEIYVHVLLVLLFILSHPLVVPSCRPFSSILIICIRPAIFGFSCVLSYIETKLFLSVPFQVSSNAPDPSPVVGIRFPFSARC